MRWLELLWATYLVCAFSFLMYEPPEFHQEMEEYRTWQREEGARLAEYIDKVCAGEWVDTENLKPVCGDGK